MSKINFYIGIFGLITIVSIFETNTLAEVNVNISKKHGTYKSFIEIMIEDLGSTSESSNQTFIGKSFSEILEMFEEYVHLIFPGTKWCGPGNIATDYDDLGVFNETDSCCRTHDNCPNNILAGNSLGPLINDGIFTRSACSCDHKFYDCLKKAKSMIATSIGETYFNIIRPQCFELNYPIESCAQYEEVLGNLGKKCVNYNFDKSKAKQLQWFDNRNF